MTGYKSKKAAAQDKLAQPEALKLALEALKQTLQTLDDENAKPGGAIADTIWHSEHETLFDYLVSEITVIEKALAQLEQEPVAHPFQDKSVISALSWAAGLIEQSYRACGGHNGADSWLMNYADKQGERTRQADHREWEKVNGRWQVKATTPSPPQRTWVGLTDEEIMEITNKANTHPETMQMTRDRLKEKNSG